MQKVTNSDTFHFKDYTVVTIGTFDGVHIGHQKIIKRLIESANNSLFKSVILTFFPHPRMVLQTDANIKLLNTIEERGVILKSLGLDILYIKTFTEAFSRLSAEDFVKNLLVEQLKAKKVIIGYDHQFGRNRAANINDLKRFGDFYGFEVEEIPAQDINEVAISSTKIRTALNEGDIEKANKYLGYNYMLSGNVVKGKALGREIGFPTANLLIEEDYKLIPKQGSYVVGAIMDDKQVFGMMNIGINPTVKGQNQSIEIHFFNFDKNIYDENIKVSLLHRIRDEFKFESLEALKGQLKKDKIYAQNYIEQTYAS